MGAADKVPGWARGFLSRCSASSRSARLGAVPRDPARGTHVHGISRPIGFSSSAANSPVRGCGCHCCCCYSRCSASPWRSSALCGCATTAAPASPLAATYWPSMCGSERWPDHPAPRPPPASARAPLMPAFRLLHPCTRSSTDPPVRHIHTPRRRGALSEARLSPMGSVVWQN